MKKVQFKLESALFSIRSRLAQRFAVLWCDLVAVLDTRAGQAGRFSSGATRDIYSGEALRLCSGVKLPFHGCAGGGLLGGFTTSGRICCKHRLYGTFAPKPTLDFSRTSPALNCLLV